MVPGLRDGVEAPEEFMTASEARQRLFDFLALPLELREMVYEQVVLDMFTQRRHEDIPGETPREFRLRNPILFLNKQITQEFFLFTQEPNPATGERDRLDGTAPIEYYTSADWAIYDDVDGEEVELLTFMDTSSVTNIARVEIFINTASMDEEILMYHLEDINKYFGYMGTSASRDYDQIHIIYTDPGETKIGIRHGEYTIVKDREKDIYKTTFVRKVADEVGDIEVITEVTEALDWTVDEHLPYAERERVFKRAEEESLRYHNLDGQCRDVLGPLEHRGEREEATSCTRRPEDAEKRDVLHNEE